MPEQITNTSSATPYDIKTKRESLEKNKRSSIPSNVRVVTNPNQGLDKDSFLKLLVTELSHQDPMKPMNDREFISQMAQFSALEQMQNVSKSMNSLKAFQANSLVGKVITGKDMVHSRDVSGVVKKVFYDKSGNVFLNIQNYTIKLDDIYAIEDANPDKQQETSPVVNQTQHTQPVKTEQKTQNVSRETISENSLSKPDENNHDHSYDKENIRNIAKNFVYDEIFQPVNPENNLK